jgi:hypothetical protein
LLNRIWAALVVSALGATSAQALASSRLTASPRPGQALRAGSATTLAFDVDEEAEEMEVLLSLDGGRTFPLRVTREMSEGTHQLTWRVPNLPTTSARLALRVGTEDEGEVIRDVSPEFTISPAESEPLEDVRPFRGEWRAGDALAEMPFTAPFDALDLGGASESIRALPHELDFDRTNFAALTGAPPDGNIEKIQPTHRDPVCTPISTRFPLTVPRRE